MPSLKMCPKCEVMREPELFYSVKSVHKSCVLCRRPSRKFDEIKYIEFRKKQNIRHRTRYAISIGKLIKGLCESCGTDKDIQAHHEDYDKPLEINWLCKPCHMTHHNIFGYGKSAKTDAEIVHTE